MIRLQGSRPSVGGAHEGKKVHEGVCAMMTWQGAKSWRYKDGARKTRKCLMPGYSFAG